MQLNELSYHLKYNDINFHVREVGPDGILSHDVYICQKTGKKLSFPVDIDIEPEYIEFACVWFNITFPDQANDNTQNLVN